MRPVQRAVRHLDPRPDLVQVEAELGYRYDMPGRAAFSARLPGLPTKNALALAQHAAWHPHPEEAAHGR